MTIQVDFGRRANEDACFLLIPGLSGTVHMMSGRRRWTMSAMVPSSCSGACCASHCTATLNRAAVMTDIRLSSAHYPPERRRAETRQDLSDALEDCSLALRAQLQNGNPGGEMCRTVAAFAIRVRTQQVPPERALAGLKDRILRLPEVSALGTMERGEIVRLLAQRLIDAYYEINSAS